MVMFLATLASAYTAEESEVLALYNKDQLLSARRKSEAILTENPESIAANFVLGCAFREEEGDLGQAMYHLSQARRRYENSPGEAPPEVHREMLNEIQLVAGEMDQYEYQLQMLDYYDYLYDPDLTAEHAWPLMKLGRYDEARASANLALASSDAGERSVARTSLCAIETAAGQREAAFNACKAAFDESKADGSGATVEGYNAAGAAMAVLDFKKAQEILGEAVTQGTAGSTNPWRPLMDLYLLEGRGDLAVSAAADMQRWKAQQPPESRDQNRAELDAALATLLLVAGQSDMAKDIIDRSLRYPDRRGTTSTNADQSLGGHTTLRLAIRRLQHARDDEAASTWGFFSRVSHWFGGFLPDFDAWADRATVASVLADTDTLDGTLRLYTDRGLEQVPAWMVGDLVDIVGSGVISVGLERVRTEETFPAYTAYYDAIAADIALADGDEDEAIRLSALAISGLPADEKLLHARMAAVAAQAYEASGDQPAAFASYAEAMRADPSVIRRMGLSMPARIDTTSTGAAGGYVAAMLGRSPRFYYDPDGFVLSVDGTDQQLQVCLRTPDGGQLGCVTPPPIDQPEPDPNAPADAPPPEPITLTDWEVAQRTAMHFHDKVFSLPVGSWSLDMRSLDGTTTSTTEANRLRTDEMLNGLMKSEQKTP